VNDDVCEVCIDDVSCFDIDLPAYAGPDRSVIPGDSVFIGSNDPGLDEFCTWYQLPNFSTPIATVSGLYVKPVTTTTYVVRQQLWCSGVRFDTVVVYEDAVGIAKQKFQSLMLKVFPVPASKELFVDAGKLNSEMQIAEIFNAKGEKIKTVDVSQTEGPFKINLEGFEEGIYYFRVSLKDNGWFGKTFVVER
jgi:hypothetical protein